MSAFCGSAKVPKGSVRGTKQQCISMGQVRYYGIKKIDRDLLTTKTKSSYKDEKKKLLLLLASNKGNIRRLNFEKERTVNPDKKQLIKIEIDKLKKQNIEIIKEYKKLEDNHKK